MLSGKPGVIRYTVLSNIPCYPIYRVIRYTVLSDIPCYPIYRVIRYTVFEQGSTYFPGFNNRYIQFRPIIFIGACKFEAVEVFPANWIAG